VRFLSRKIVFLDLDMTSFQDFGQIYVLGKDLNAGNKDKSA
jgi:hypothetical protein